MCLNSFFNIHGGEIDISVEFRVNSRSIMISAKTRNLFFSRARCEVSIISYSREEADTGSWARLVLEERRGQRSEKRLSLRHCHTILPPGPSLGYPRQPLALPLFLSFSLCSYLYRARSPLSLPRERSIILPLCTYGNASRPSPVPSSPFSSLDFIPYEWQETRRSIEESTIVSVSLDLRCYSGLRPFIGRWDIGHHS